MHDRRRSLLIVCLPVIPAILCGCHRPGPPAAAAQPIVGTWVVHDPEAPFPYHMYVFNADGTMQQANPDAGDAHASDSDGKGVWVAEGGVVRGKWVEITADRVTHQYTGRAEIAYRVRVTGNTFAGTVTAYSYDTNGKLTDGPTPDAPLDGRRVTLP